MTVDDKKSEIAREFWDWKKCNAEEQEQRRLRMLDYIATLDPDSCSRSNLEESVHGQEQDDEETDQVGSWELEDGESTDYSDQDAELVVEVDSIDYVELVNESEWTKKLASTRSKPSEYPLGQISEPTKADLAGDTAGFGEPFSEFMTRLHKMKNMIDMTKKVKWVDDTDEEEETLSEDPLFSKLDYIMGSEEAEDSSGWNRISLLPDPWAEARNPTAQILGRHELTMDDLKPDLNLRTLATGLSNLTTPPGCSSYVCTKLQLQGMRIKTIGVLAKHHYLQYIDLTMNDIEDISPLWEIRHLVVLDVSNNMVSENSFGSPHAAVFLTYLNLSHNNFSCIPDLSHCWALKHLNLSFNGIKQIENLETLDYLEYLNLSANEIETIENLTNVQLKEVDFSFNIITDWSAPLPKSLRNLEIVNVAGNHFRTLLVFREMYNLKSLNASNNLISNMSDFDCLKTLPGLTDLWLYGNELMTMIPDGRRLIIHNIPELRNLDGTQIQTMERVSAHSMYAMNSIHTTMCHDAVSFYSQHSRNPPTGWESRKPVGQHPALIVLIGFIGSLREEVVFKTVDLNPYKLRVLRTTSTRPKIRNPTAAEQYRSRFIYKHVSLKKFSEIEAAGGFVVTDFNLGYKFGIEPAEMEQMDQVLITLLCLPAALELVWQGYNPTLILVYPKEKDCLINRISKWVLKTKIFSNQNIQAKEREAYGRKYKPGWKRRKKKRIGNKEIEKYKYNKLPSGLQWDGFGKRKEDSLVGIFSNGEQAMSRKRKKRKRKIQKKMHRLVTTTGQKGFDWTTASVDTEIKIAKRKVKFAGWFPSGFSDPIFARNTERIFERGASPPFELDWCPEGSKGRPFRESREIVQERSETSSSMLEIGRERSKVSLQDNDSVAQSEMARFLLNILKLRDSYNEQHIRNPSLFRLYLPSDNTTAAAMQLNEIVNELYDQLMKMKESDKVELADDPLFEKNVMPDLREYTKEIRTDHIPPDIIH